MPKEKSPEYAHWNGKNIEGGDRVGAPGLIGEGPRTGRTGAKYQVANDTVSADNLQERPGKKKK